MLMGDSHMQENSKKSESALGMYDILDNGEKVWEDISDFQGENR